MSLHPDRIQETHLSRKACVYVRQSSVAQVLEHQESTRRQYGLRERARQLGWAEERIEVIDEDLGHSASDAAKPRPGFQGLLGHRWSPAKSGRSSVWKSHAWRARIVKAIAWWKWRP